MAGTIRDVASLAGVSVGTVSNVLNRPEDVSESSRERVERAIADLGYRGGTGIRKQIPSSSSTILGLIIDDGANPFVIELVRAAAAEASAQGFALLSAYSEGDRQSEDRYLDLFLDHGARGVLISPIGDATAKLLRLRSRGIAAVLVDRFSDDGTFSSVSVDNRDGGYIAVSHLLETRHSRVAFVGPLQASHMRGRLIGAEDAVRESTRGAVIEAISTESASAEAGTRAAEELLARSSLDRPDAVFAGNDLIALGLIEALRRGGVRIPADMAVVGFDDIPFGSGASVPLSTIRQPAETIGRTAIRVLLEEAADPRMTPRQTVFRPQLVQRTSSRARKGHSAGV